MIMFSRASGVVIYLINICFSTLSVAASIETQTSNTDPHYTPAGFFDIHVCNWPNQPLFFLSVFSTTKFKDVVSINVKDPNGKPVTTIGLNRFRLVKNKGKPDKRVFITLSDVVENAPNGWYTASIKLKDGATIIARDYVVIESMQNAQNPKPADKSEDIPVPRKLAWDKVPGAAYYQVYIRDAWEDDKLILDSKLQAKPELVIPRGLLKPDGLYTWKIHARDVNGNIILGDFNHGSLSPAFKFSTASE